MNTLKITASIGVCFCAPESNMSHHEVFKMADDAAYASKNKGRNQVTIFKELLRENPTQHPSSKEYTP